MSKVNNFDTLAEMSKRNLDIKLATLDNISEINTNEKAGYVTFGIPREVATKLALHPENFVGGFILADREEFFNTADSLSEQQDKP